MSRQLLNRVMLDITGEDIRLIGNWELPRTWKGNVEEIADRLQIDRTRLHRCRDIAEVVDLIETPAEDSAPQDGPSLW